MNEDWSNGGYEFLGLEKITRTLIKKQPGTETRLDAQCDDLIIIKDHRQFYFCFSNTVFIGCLDSWYQQFPPVLLIWSGGGYLAQ